MDDLPLTRQSLIVRLKRSSDDAWNEFLTVYEQAIFRYCCSRGLQDADARDVTQEVFSALHSRINEWDMDASKGSFRGWLFRVARNLAVDKTREKARRPVSAADATLAGLPQATEAEESAFLYEYRRTLFQWAAGHVKHDVQQVTWQCFWETAVQNKKASDVARQLNISVGSVYTAKCRAVARIREKLATLSHLDDETIDPFAGEMHLDLLETDHFDDHNYKQPELGTE